MPFVLFKRQSDRLIASECGIINALMINEMAGVMVSRF